MPSLRVLSVNARILAHDRDQLARLIAQAAPHVVCVHGSPALLRWRSISAALARKAGLVVVGGGRTGGANLLLSTLGVDVIALRDVRFGPRSLREPGGATLALVTRDGAQLLFVGAHVVGDPAQQQGQVAELERIVAGAVPGAPPAVVCLDAGSEAVSGAVTMAAGGRSAAGDTSVFTDAALTVTAARTPQPGVHEVTIEFVHASIE